MFHVEPDLPRTSWTASSRPYCTVADTATGDVLSLKSLMRKKKYESQIFGFPHSQKGSLLMSEPFMTTNKKTADTAADEKVIRTEPVTGADHVVLVPVLRGEGER